MADKWLNPSVLARTLGVSRRTIYNWLEAGKLNWRRTIGGGSVLIDPQSVWLDYDGDRKPFDTTGATRGDVARMKARA